MRVIFLGLCMALLAAVLSAQDARPENYRYAAKDSVPVYKSDVRKISEAPLFFLKKGDRVKIAGGSPDKDSVTLADGRTGWVEKTRLTESNKYALYLEELKVYGFLDNPDPVYILDYTNEEYKPIRVSRDFIFDPELMKNIVKENFEWENEIYYYKGYKFSPEAVNPPENVKIKQGE
jgi:hypothetical protein